ncbi:hypothetical protein GmRootV15_11710 [Variovorax sp. V15]
MAVTATDLVSAANEGAAASMPRARATALKGVRSKAFFTGKGLRVGIGMRLKPPAGADGEGFNGWTSRRAVRAPRSLDRTLHN